MCGGVLCRAAEVMFTGVGSAQCTVVLHGKSLNVCGCDLSHAIVKAHASKAKSAAAHAPTAQYQRQRVTHRLVEILPYAHTCIPAQGKYNSRIEKFRGMVLDMRSC